jgi:tRNA 2-thiouridine synthesizing protein A
MNDELDPLDDELVTQALLLDLKSIRERRCTVCSAAICGHEALMSLAMGFKSAPQCAACLSESLGHSKEALRDRLSSFITSRNCYNEGWLWANQEEGVAPDALPRCLWPTVVPTANQSEETTSAENGNGVDGSADDFNAEWDAGDIGCGDLVLELRTRMKPMLAGQIMRLLATNPGAQEDLPSWCRLTGNTLISTSHPVYIIRKK